MPFCLGIDTSNYTTSTALFDTDKRTIVHSKKLLPVKEGQLGLRQSDAVFHHTKQLPEMMSALFDRFEDKIGSIGVSYRPRNIDGSYMPCFLVGEGTADIIGAVNKIPVHKTSHQIGHILAALYSSDKLELVRQRFIAFHVSGGTTDCLIVEPDENEVIKATEIGTSLDLKAGQTVDRTGIMMGLKFPCGKELEKLALNSTKKIKANPVIKNGSCCLSGLENKCRKMLDDGEKHSDIAAYCLDFIYRSIKAMTEYAILNYGELPVVYAGGVMSNKIIRSKLEKDFEAYFAEPDFSCDNAAGTAVFSAIRENFI